MDYVSNPWKLPCLNQYLLSLQLLLTCSRLKSSFILFSLDEIQQCNFTSIYVSKEAALELDINKKITQEFLQKVHLMSFLLTFACADDVLSFTIICSYLQFMFIINNICLQLMSKHNDPPLKFIARRFESITLNYLGKIWLRFYYKDHL